MMKSCAALLLVILLLAGCVNVHVHFPSAPASADETKKP